MADLIPCPGCGKPFEPIIRGSKKKYCSENCGAKMRMRRKTARDRRKKQRALQFQPIAKAERRVKSRSLAEQGREESKEERLFA